jgi:putative ABC transport system permease protein
LKLLRNELKNEPSIVSVATAEIFPGQYWQNYNNFEPNVSENLEEISLRQITIDDRYFETLKINVVLGRDFLDQPKRDSASVIINQTAFNKLNWTDLNNKFLLAGGDENEKYKVVGVVEDYYYQSLQSGIQPVIHYYSDYVNNKMIVRFHSDHLQSGVNLLKNKWEEMESFEPLEYNFIDSEFDKLYKSHERMGATTTIFSVIAIIIASLGLFSIASFTIRTRRKEVGIRKVLGPTMENIIIFLSKWFSYLTLIAFVIACPVAYYLSDFVNKT